MVINKDQDIVECMARIARFINVKAVVNVVEGAGWMWRILDRIVKEKQLTTILIYYPM